MAVAARWHAAPGVLVKAWGETTAVAYVPGSARTHLISAEAADLLLRCRVEPGIDGADAPAELVGALAEAGLIRLAQ